jgi:hypothetical protein
MRVHSSYHIEPPRGAFERLVCSAPKVAGGAYLAGAKQRPPKKHLTRCVSSIAGRLQGTPPFGNQLEAMKSDLKNEKEGGIVSYGSTNGGELWAVVL